MISITVSPAVRRLNPLINERVGIIYRQGQLRVGSYVLRGDTVENVLAVPYSTHEQIINAIDKDKLRELDAARSEF